MAKKAKKKKPGKLAKVPKALRASAQKLVDRAKAELEQEVRDLVARAKGALAQANRNLYEVACALAELAKPDRAKALGHRDVYALAQKELDMSRTNTVRLIAAATQVTQERFAELKMGRVNACLELATATVADDTEAILAGKRVRLWRGGPQFDVGAASTPEILQAAKQVRQHESGAKPERRGRTTSADERELVARATKQLARKKSAARFKARATKAGQPAVFDLVGMTQAEAERALRAL